MNSNLPLIDDQTLFIVPFSFDDEEEIKKSLASIDSIWEDSELTVEPNILYPHIEQYWHAYANATRREEANKNTTTKESSHAQEYNIYSLKYSSSIDPTNKESLHKKMKTWELFARQEWNCTQKEVLKMEESFRVGAHLREDSQDKLFSPHIILWPYAHVGLLTFSTHFSEKGRKGEESKTIKLNNLIEFNYSFRKIGIGRQSMKCVLPPDKSKVPLSDIGLQTWDSTQLINFLLSSLHVDLCNKRRIHAITYYQIAEDAIKGCPKDELMNDFIRVAKVENEKFKVRGEDTKESSELILKTFDNIFFASTIEGCAIMVIKPGEGSGYCEQFKTVSFEKRYLWIYLMILLQRHSQLYWIGRLTQPDNRNDMGKLKEMVLRIREIKASSYFTDVADYTHLNQFYRLCKRNLCIGEHFKEIEEKLIPIYEAIREEERSKEEKRREKKQSGEEKRMKAFSIILGLLGLISIPLNVYEYFQSLQKDISFKWIAGISIIVLLLAGYFLYRIYFRKTKNKN